MGGVHADAAPTCWLARWLASAALLLAFGDTQTGPDPTSTHAVAAAAAAASSSAPSSLRFLSKITRLDRTTNPRLA